ncbi:NmrA-like family [Seminavis robusta]|uniref:NmrA-like family n=1 Tax=Seminavis robusta TaxID=568900 RepID=A0A9N8DLK0_9STRA|nr:NmrA-like family [Seminavis robusta]|eukprot:Sro226_g092090.1 NmrA-like family (272) ;mRNA; r:69408-70223
MTGETIGLFGGTGSTGNYFLRLALEAGFKVQACVRNPDKIDKEIQDKYKDKDKDQLVIVQGTFTEKQDIAKTIQGATYVVCMAGAPMGKPKEYPKDIMLTFFTTLTQVIQENNTSSTSSTSSSTSSTPPKVVLYQAGAFSPTPDRPLTMIHSVFKAVGQWVMGLGPNVDDNTQVIAYIHQNINTLGFNTIVSRPGMLNDKPGGNVQLKADHFSPTNFAITFSDLAIWSLKAIQDSSLYGTFPFVVPIDQDILPRKKEPAASNKEEDVGETK